MNKEKIIVDIHSKDRWYHKSHRKYQSSLYNLFVKTHKINIQIVIDAIEKMREEYSCSKPIMLTMIESFCFDELIEKISDQTGVKFKKRKNIDYDWDDWWQEKNLDGSFAYNRVTDDF